MVAQDKIELSIRSKGVAGICDFEKNGILIYTKKFKTVYARNSE